MKTKSFIALGMAAALAAGCSSDDIVDDGGNNGGSNGSGKAFVSLNITLPSSAGTRSINNDFEHGSADEYKVSSLKVTYFYKEGNVDKTFSKTYDPSELAWEKPVSPVNGITTKALLPVQEVPFNGPAKVLVEVNTPENFAVDQVTPQQCLDVAKLTGEEQDCFFMTNTVNDDGTYLVPVMSYAKKTDAQNSASDQTIYVERAVAKVQLFTDWTGDYTISTGVNADSKVTIDKWQLDVTNKWTYAVRRFDVASYPAANYPRFYCGAPNRTYWAQDPNYDSYSYSEASETGNFHVIKNVNGITNAVGDIEYCLENTFDTKHQKQDETTRVLVSAIYTPKELVSEEGYTAGDTWYLLGNATKGYSATGVKRAIADALNEMTTPEGTLDASNISLEGIFIVAGTQEEMTTASFKINGTEPNDGQLAFVKNRLGRVTTYLNGRCYYGIRIKHLDYYCPWGVEGAPSFDETIYVDYVNSTHDRSELEKAYLGRYGVVRNNWYKVTINSISQPGTPTIPELTKDPDDQQKYYLQATINILDWAVRTQTEDL